MMKRSLLLSFVIAMTFAGLGWRKAQAVDAAREERDRLAFSARELGIDPRHPLEKKRREIRPIHPQDEGAPQSDVKDLASRMRAIASRVGKLARAGQNWDDETQKKFASFSHEASKLPTAELEELLGELRRSPDMDPDGFSLLSIVSLTILAKENPQAALAFCTDTSGSKLQSSVAASAIENALKNWGLSDPQAALAWLGEDDNSGPQKASESRRKRSAIYDGAAKQDPRMAFSLISSAPEGRRMDIAEEIAGKSNDAASRMGILQGMRDYMAANPDDGSMLDRTIGGLVTSFRNGSYASVESWLDEAQFTPAEILSLSARLPLGGMGSSAAAEWTDRLAAKLPEGEEKDDLLKKIASQRATAH